jgi:Protein of unknown function (DUF3489)
MSMKLTDTQLAMLSAAAKRGDRCVVAPKNLKGGAAQKVALKLSAEGLVKEIITKAGLGVWRRDDGAGRSYSLKLTAAGLKAVTSESNVQPTAADEDVAGSVSEVADKTAARAATKTPATPPRDGTKIAKVIGLLQRNDGATLDEVIAATGWLPHTSRAAFTGLRKRGYAIERRQNAGGGKGYVIVSAPQAQSA